MKSPSQFLKEALTALLLAFISPALSAQVSHDHQSKDHSYDLVYHFNIAGLAGLGYEQGLGKNFTACTEIGLGWPVITNKENEFSGVSQLEVKSFANPYVMVEGRYYYNLGIRKAEKKTVSRFSADYVSVFYRLNTFKNHKENSVENLNVLRWNQSSAGIWWGMQRTFDRAEKYYFNFSMGPAVQTDIKTYCNFNIAGNIGFGFQW